MLFPTLEHVTRLARELRALPRVEVSDELRGWSWEESPVTATQSRLLGVSDITSGFCPTGRDLYLRYVEGVRGRDNPTLQMGRLVHEVFEAGVEEAKKAVYLTWPDTDGDRVEEFMRAAGEALEKRVIRKYGLLNQGVAAWVFRRLWGMAVRTYSAAVDEARTKSRYLRLDSLVHAAVPVIAEFPIDGSTIGLSRALRVDALLPPNIMMELKTREPRRVFEVALAGYALAMEAQYGSPVNYALLTYVWVRPEAREIMVRPKVVPISEDLRQDFIDARDERREIVEYGVDPGKPRDGCPPECPYRHYCVREG